MFKYLIALAAVAALSAGNVFAGDFAGSFQKGSIELQSAGPLAFGPDGVLLLSDPMAATIYAVDTGDASGDAAKTKHDIADLRGKIASLLGSSAEDVRINDLAVNPKSGNIYLSVTRGSGPDAASLVLKIDGQQNISEVPLKDVSYAKATLGNAPASGESRRGNPRMMTVTDLGFMDGRVFVAGLSNEEFASKLRAIPFPFAQADNGASVEIYHGSHGALETRSPIMTFASYQIGSEPHVLAAYTCTPLVKFKVADLKAGEKVRGTTVAELGNRNRPLDMFVYQKDGKDYLLMANSDRGVMKIATEPLGSAEAITERIADKAGVPYETVESLQGVTQLDRLNATSAVALIRGESGAEDLKTVALP